MKSHPIPWLVAALLLATVFLFLTSTAEAKGVCRDYEGGSTAAALGEDFPEFVPIFGFWPIWWGALGEEFPEYVQPEGLWTVDSALGEDFPERADQRDPSGTGDALGEEFPE